MLEIYEKPTLLAASLILAGKRDANASSKDSISICLEFALDGKDYVAATVIEL